MVSSNREEFVRNDFGSTKALMSSMTTDELLALEDHFVFVEDEDSVPVEAPIPVPQNFPKHSRFLGQFTHLKPFKDGNESFHPTYTGMANGKKYFIKFNIDPGIKEGKKHYLISKASLPADANVVDTFLKAEIRSQFEAACWRWYRIAAPDVVSKAVHPCFAYDKEEKAFRFIAVASEEIPGFRPNRFDPLQESDLRIHFLDEDLRKKRPQLMRNLAELSKLLDRSNDANTSYFYSFWNNTKQACTNLNEKFWGTTKSATTLKPVIDGLLEQNKKKQLNEENIHKLLPKLIERKKHVESLCDYYKTYPELLKKYSEELEILKHTIDNASPDIRKLEEIDSVVDHMIEQVENQLLDEYQTARDNEIIRVEVFDQTVDVSIKELKDHGLIDKLKATTKLNGTACNKSFTITAKDIQNYRIKRGLPEAHGQSWICAEADFHNKNGSRKGKRIDFDMSEWPFFSQFKQVNWAEWLKRNLDLLMGALAKLVTFSNPNEEFPFTQADFENFPNLKDDKRRYWPTESTSFAQVSQSTSIKIPFFENFYTPNDIRLFRGLATDPVYVFHAYKNFLRNLIIPENMYRKSMELEVKYDQFYPDPIDNTMKKNLIDNASAYKVNRLQNLKNLLYKAPQFREFLEINGDYAFNLILKSYEKDKHDPYLKDITHLDEIRKEYDKVLIAAGIKKEHIIKEEMHTSQIQANIIH